MDKYIVQLKYHEDAPQLDKICDIFCGTFEEAKDVVTEELKAGDLIHASISHNGINMYWLDLDKLNGSLNFEIECTGIMGEGGMIWQTR